MRYEVVEADSLIPSHKVEANGRTRSDPRFPVELRRADRASGQTAERVEAIVSAFRPDRLGATWDANDGAPIVGPDGAVETGGVRALALQGLYKPGREGQAESYRRFLEEAGFKVEGVRRPVLIARRVSGLDPDERAEFVRVANDNTPAPAFTPDNDNRPVPVADNDNESALPEQLRMAVGQGGVQLYKFVDAATRLREHFATLVGGPNGATMSGEQGGEKKTPQVGQASNENPSDPASTGAQVGAAGEGKDASQLGGSSNQEKSDPTRPKNVGSGGTGYVLQPRDENSWAQLQERLDPEDRTDRVWTIPLNAPPQTTKETKTGKYNIGSNSEKQQKEAATQIANNPDHYAVSPKLMKYIPPAKYRFKYMDDLGVAAGIRDLLIMRHSFNAGDSENRTTSAVHVDVPPELASRFGDRVVFRGASGEMRVCDKGDLNLKPEINEKIASIKKNIDEESFDHAEVDALKQFAASNLHIFLLEHKKNYASYDINVRLFVDRFTCKTCRGYRGIKAMMRILEIKELEIVSPVGVWVYKADYRGEHTPTVGKNRKRNPGVFWF